MIDKLYNAILGYRHKFYDKNVEDYEFNKMVVYGEDYGKFVMEYKSAETEEQKEQRAKITQNRTTSVIDKADTYISRPFRVDKLKDSILVPEGEQGEQLLDEVQRFGEHGETLTNYIEDTYKRLNTIDANALFWINSKTNEDGSITFNPHVFYSPNVLDFKMDKGRVKYAVTGVTEEYSVVDKNGVLKTFTIPVFYLFTDTAIVQAIEYLDELQDYAYYEQYKESEDDVLNLKEVGDRVFLLIEDENITGRTPLTTVGYKLNEGTQARTYQVYWAGAKEEIKGLIYDGTAFDIAKQLHLFPKEIIYYQKCEYQDVNNGDECRNGYMHISGDVCPNCNGTGEVVHISGQDVIKIQIPTADEPQTVAPKDFAHYVQMPFDIVNKQHELVKEATPKIMECIFGVDLSTKANGSKTATEITNFYDTAQDTLFEFAKGARRMFLFSIDIMARAYNLVDSIEADLVYTNEYRLESEQELIATLKAAKDAQASPEVIENIEDRILAKQNRTNSARITVSNAIKKFLPYRSVEKEIRVPHVLSLPNKSLVKALFLNFKQITDDIIENHPEFTASTYDRQLEIVQEKAAAFRDKAVEENTPAGIETFREPIEE